MMYSAHSPVVAALPGHEVAKALLLLESLMTSTVKKGLKSVGTTCDAGNYVLFTEWGGYIINDKTHKHIEVDRVGNVYAIDAWIRDGSRAASGFARQAASP